MKNEPNKTNNTEPEQAIEQPASVVPATTSAMVNATDESQESGLQSPKATKKVIPPGASPVSGVVPPVEHRFKKGQVANPSGGPKMKPLKDALNKIGKLDPEALVNFKPKTMWEKCALAMFEHMQNPTRSSGAGVSAFKEMSDRVEGKAVPSEEELEANRQPTIVIGTKLMPDRTKK